MKHINLVLGIETSCDETGLALYSGTHGLIHHVLHSQTNTHAAYGGVVPELASRDHSSKIISLFKQLLDCSATAKADIDAVAYTKGPGLVGALLTGATFATSLAYALNIPVLGVHHLEGHILAPMLTNAKPDYPFLALLVSGGHTLICAVHSFGNYTMLGSSLDDAAGEAFDKVAKLLKLGYPGGPKLAKLAAAGDPSRFPFTPPMLHKNTLDFSFSGLKTQVRNLLMRLPSLTLQDTADIASSTELAIVTALLSKLQLAIRTTKITNVVVAGGVSANLLLRSKLELLIQEVNGQLFLPALEFCTDNAAMIAYAGYERLRRQQLERDLGMVWPRWDLSELAAS